MFQQSTFNVFPARTDVNTVVKLEETVSFLKFCEETKSKMTTLF